MSNRTALAVQDTSCLDRIKFRCTLPDPISMTQCDALKRVFSGDRVTHQAFSALIPSGRDLLSVARQGVYQLDLVVGDKTLILSFESTDKTWPVDIMEQVTAQLSQSGFRSIEFEARADVSGALGAFYEDKAIRVMIQQARIDRPLSEPDISITKVSRTCGSRVTIEACLDGEGRLSEIGYRTTACDIATLATRILSLHAPGLTLKDISRVRTSLSAFILGQPVASLWPELHVFSSVRDLPQRHAAIYLAFDALIEALTRLEMSSTCVSRSGPDATR